jgi:hypothetical protein
MKFNFHHLISARIICNRASLVSLIENLKEAKNNILKITLKIKVDQKTEKIKKILITI